MGIRSITAVGADIASIAVFLASDDSAWLEASEQSSLLGTVRGREWFRENYS
jgi:hypothetical protein